jgi:regulator of replication initiation timing
MRKGNIRQQLEQRIAKLEKDLKEARQALVMKNQGNAQLVAERNDLAQRVLDLEAATGLKYFKPQRQVDA